MTGPTPQDLASMRAVVAETALAGTAVIQRPSFSSDSQGGQVATFASAGTVACHIAPVTGDRTGGEPVAGDRVTTTRDWMLTLPSGTDVRATDRIVASGRTLEVDTVRTPRTYEVSCRVRAHEVD